ncbi:MAG: ion channel [Candidatus Pacearchaeota archaeon]
MKKVIERHSKMIRESRLTKILFDKPLLKFIILILIEFVISTISNLFQKNYLPRLFFSILNILIVIYFVAIIIYVARKSYDNLMNPKNFYKLIGSYILLILVIILIFSTLYNFVELSKLGYIKYGECNGNFDPSMISSDPQISREFFYFTTMTFFTVGYGDICPMGFERIISIIAAFTGHIVSVIFVALIINNYFRKRKED